MKSNSIIPALELLFFLLCPLQIKAGGSLSISPTRVIVNEHIYMSSVTIQNSGKDSAFYEVSFVEFRMTDEGRLTKIAANDSSIQIASPYLQVYPREIDLAPNESQTVMVRFRSNTKLPDGEYRSHLYFKSKNKEIKSNENTISQGSFRITPLVGITIPVILRVGETWSNAEIKNIKYTAESDSAWRADLDIIRQGNISLFGDIKIYYSPNFGSEQLVGQLKGVATYTNLNKRKASIRLTLPNGIAIKSGHFIVRYTDPMQKDRILAEQKTKIIDK